MSPRDSAHQSQLAPADNKFHVGNGDDGKHYWLTPPDLYAELDAEFAFTFDPCPYPLPEGFDGLTCEWGSSNYVNIPFGSIMHQGRKKGPTAWVRKAIEEWRKGKRVVLVYPVDKWLLMLLTAILGDHAQVRNLGDVKWLATEDGSQGKGTGRHIACFILEPEVASPQAISVSLGNGGFTLVSPEDEALARQWSWHGIKVNGQKVYAMRTARVGGRGGKPVTRYLHRLIISAGPGAIVDHINGDGLDNRRENLRLADATLNSVNKATRAISGYRGVYRDSANRWRAEISNRGTVTRKTFSCPIAAARHYDALALEAFGEFARLNFPNEAV